MNLTEDKNGTGTLFLFVSLVVAFLTLFFGLSFKSVIGVTKKADRALPKEERIGVS